MFENGVARLVGEIARRELGNIRIFADDARLWCEWSENINRLSRPRASLEIAELLLA